ncbi:MAG: exostosin family protein [Hormoscilla sp.]
MESQIKLYVNSRLIDRQLSYSPLLYPFWGSIYKASTPFISAVWQQQYFDSAYYQIVDSLEDADFYFIPHNYWLLQKYNPNLLKTFVQEAIAQEQPILIDAYGDSTAEIDVKNSVILRTSQYRFNLKNNEIILPAYAEDLLQSYCNNQLGIRAKPQVPVIGFCGWGKPKLTTAIAKLPKTAYINYLSIFNPKAAALKKGLFFREYILKNLRKFPDIQTNFVINQVYSGYLLNPDIKNQLRMQFVNNLLNSDYVLCVKGDGNYSMRFYEALSLGRIPLFVDTECVLPLSERINYHSFCVFVSHQEIKDIGKNILDFHQNIAPDRFVEMQIKSRHIFEDYLRINSFTKHLVQILQKIRIERNSDSVVRI